MSMTEHETAAMTLATTPSATEPCTGPPGAVAALQESGDDVGRQRGHGSPEHGVDWHRRALAHDDADDDAFNCASHAYGQSAMRPVSAYG